MRLGTLSITQTANVPGIFNEGVLKAPARSEEGPPRFTSVSIALKAPFMLA
jgi:hypothetical protein